MFNFYKYIFLYIIGLFFTCVPVRKDNLLQKFQLWGPVYEIEFDITVTNFDRKHQWTNVFHFTKEGTDGKFPSLMINNHKKTFVIEEIMVTKTNTSWNINDIELNKKYHFEIRTTKTAGANRYTFEIFVNNNMHTQKDFAKNSKRLKDVVLYASDPWKNSSFTSNFGSFESFSVST